jgi:hypothetical protein
VPSSEALVLAQAAKDKVLVEHQMIADIKSGSYSSAWVDELLRQKGA